MPIKKLWDLTDPDDDDKKKPPDHGPDVVPMPAVWGKAEFDPKLFTPRGEPSDPEAAEAPNLDEDGVPEGLSMEERMEWIVAQLDKKRKPRQGKGVLNSLSAAMDAEFVRRAEDTSSLGGSDISKMATDDTIAAMTLMKRLLEDNPSMDELMLDVARLVTARGGRRVISLLVGLLITLRTQVIQKLGDQIGGGKAVPHFHVASREEFKRQTGIDPDAFDPQADDEDDDDDDDDWDDDEEDTDDDD